MYCRAPPAQQPLEAGSGPASFSFSSQTAGQQPAAAESESESCTVKKKQHKAWSFVKLALVGAAMVAGAAKVLAPLYQPISQLHTALFIVPDLLMMGFLIIDVTLCLK